MEEVPDPQGPLTLTGQEARHIARVLRMRPGDSVEILDGQGNRYAGCLSGVGSREVLVTLGGRTAGVRPSPLEIHHCQALLKSQAMEWVVQKTSELGVQSLHLFPSARSVVDIPRERAESRLRHWREVAIAAAKQSGRGAPAEILLAGSLEEILQRWKEASLLKLLPWEEERERDIKGVLRRRQAPREAVLLVGPEGGFSCGEAEKAVATGFVTVSLGERILRAETAALTAVAILQYEWGDLRPMGPPGKPIPPRASGP